MKHLSLIALAACVWSSGAIGQIVPACATPGTDNAFLGIKTIRLWPAEAPQAKGNNCEDVPTLTEIDPQFGMANGSAVVIFPGGGYRSLTSPMESREIADWFTNRGFKAFVVSYRLTSHGYYLPVPLLDAQRAIQLVRSHASDYHIAPNRIVAIGFSAGGHLAALASTQALPGKSDAQDLVERISSKPDYLVLGYPWIGAISSDTSHLSYCKQFNIMDQCETLRRAYSPDLFVTKDTPPTFIYHTYNDQVVPVEQALRFYNALLKAGVPAEMHLFASGAHGSGLGRGDAALDQWPSLLEAWLRAQGLFIVDTSIVGIPPWERPRPAIAPNTQRTQ
jgi:acetyl esterase/lipase